MTSRAPGGQRHAQERVVRPEHRRRLAVHRRVPVGIPVLADQQIRRRRRGPVERHPHLPGRPVGQRRPRRRRRPAPGRPGSARASRSAVSRIERDALEREARVDDGRHDLVLGQLGGAGHDAHVGRHACRARRAPPAAPASSSPGPAPGGSPARPAPRADSRKRTPSRSSRLGLPGVAPLALPAQQLVVESQLLAVIAQHGLDVVRHQVGALIHADVEDPERLRFCRSLLVTASSAKESRPAGPRKSKNSRSMLHRSPTTTTASAAAAPAPRDPTPPRPPRARRRRPRARRRGAGARRA